MLRYLLFLFILLPQLSYAEEISTTETKQELVEESNDQTTNKAKIQILNKITAKAQYVTVDINSEISFHTLKLKIFKCLKSSPYELSENKILMEIAEKKNGQEDENIIFDGWMFSSSPAISSLEHAVYDIVAIDCHN